MGGTSLSLSENGSDLCVAKNYFFELVSGEQFEVVQKEVAEMLKGRILVGHALHNDLKVLPFRATPHTCLCAPAGGRFITRNVCPMWGHPRNNLF